MTGDLRARVDAVLTAFLDERIRDRGAARPGGPARRWRRSRRLVEAGGKRIRPAFCYWGFRAAGGEDAGSRDEPIVRAAAALELLHTMALVHDDLIDGAKERRGVPSTAAWFAERAEELGARGEPGDFGEAMAVLVGDLAAVLADRLLPGVGVPAGRVGARARRVPPDAGGDGDRAVPRAVGAGAMRGGPEAAGRAAALKGGGYTVEGPLRIGAALAGGSAAGGGVPVPVRPPARRGVPAPRRPRGRRRGAGRHRRDGRTAASPRRRRRSIRTSSSRRVVPGPPPARGRGGDVTEDLEMLRRLFRDHPTCRVATVRPHGGPHVATRWFVWHAGRPLRRDPRRRHDLGSPRARRPHLAPDRPRPRSGTTSRACGSKAWPSSFPPSTPTSASRCPPGTRSTGRCSPGDGFERFTAAIPKLGFLRVVPAVVDAWDHG